MAATHRRWRHIRIRISLQTQTTILLEWQKVVFTDSTNTEFKRNGIRLVAGFQFLNQGLPIQGIKDAKLSVHVWETKNPDLQTESPYNTNTFLFSEETAIG